MGYANYSGPWGDEVNTQGYIQDNFSYGSTSGRQLRVLGGQADPSVPLNDAVNITIACGNDA